MDRYKNGFSLVRFDSLGAWHARRWTASASAVGGILSGDGGIGSVVGLALPRSTSVSSFGLDTSWKRCTGAVVPMQTPTMPHKTLSQTQKAPYPDR